MPIIYREETELPTSETSNIAELVQGVDLRLQDCHRLTRRVTPDQFALDKPSERAQKLDA
jgi:hypothetical protein